MYNIALDIILGSFGTKVWQKNWPKMAEVRPNGSAEPSVEMAEPFGFGRTALLAVRSFTKQDY